MFAVLNDAPLLNAPIPVRKNRERFLPPIEPAKIKKGCRVGGKTITKHKFPRCKQSRRKN